MYLLRITVCLGYSVTWDLQSATQRSRVLEKEFQSGQNFHES